MHGVDKRMRNYIAIIYTVHVYPEYFKVQNNHGFTAEKGGFKV